MGDKLSKRIHYTVRPPPLVAFMRADRDHCSQRTYRYPKPIPDATAVPAWAYLNVAANGNNFSTTAAASDTNLPDVTSSSATSAAVPVAPFATSPSIGPTESGGNNIGSSSANFIKNRVTTIVIPVVIGGGLVLTVVIGLAMRLRKKWKLRQQRGGGAGVAAIENGEAQTREVVRGGSVSRGGMNLGVSVREHESTSTPPMEGGDSSEIQLVSRENVCRSFINVSFYSKLTCLYRPTQSHQCDVLWGVGCLSI